MKTYVDKYVKIETYYELAEIVTDKYGKHAIVPVKYYIKDELKLDTKVHMTYEEYLETK